MENHDITQPDYGTGQKKLSVYLVGVFSCIVLTLIAFGAVMAGTFSKTQTFLIMFLAACAQFFVQLVCFLRLNTQNERGQTNVMAFVFTGIILLCIVAGSLWIMWNLNFYMVH